MFDFTAPLAAVTSHTDLTYEQAYEVLDQIMQGQASPEWVAGFLTALATKGESAQEVRGLADAMRSHALATSLPRDAVDVVGTGGDGLKTVNVSTMASLLVAACGVRVVKHGNRAATSASGSADVLEALGVHLTLSPEQVQNVFDKCGIAFLFANIYHPAMRYVAPVRRALGVRTVFNVLGPLTNPARPRASAIGCAFKHAAPLMADVFASRGDTAWVFRAKHSGLDEFTTAEPMQLWLAGNNEVRYCEMDAAEVLGLPRIDVEELRGGSAQENAAVARQVLRGEGRNVGTIVALNAAVALCAYEYQAGQAPEQALKAAYERASNTLASGGALAKLQEWVGVSSQVLQLGLN